MHKVDDKVIVNEKGKNTLQKTIDLGNCKDPMPEVLEGVVVKLSVYTEVRLPIWRIDYKGIPTDIWHFLESEIN